MKTIIYINNQGQTMTEIIVASKLSTAKQYAKQYCLHHPEWKVKEIY